MQDCFERAATIITMVGGAFGWYATVRLNRSASRSQHTFDALLTTGFDPVYQGHLEEVRPYISGKDASGLPDLTQPEQTDLRKSVRFLLNYYEFLAGALRRGNLSEKLLKDDQGYILKQLFEHSQTYIAQEKDNKRSAVYENIEWLYRRWNVGKNPKYQQVFEWLLTKPLFGRLER